MITWPELKKIAVQAIVKQFKDCSGDYVKRLKYEFEQIALQGAEDYWIDLYEQQQHTATNPNGLVLPFLLRLTNVNPIKGNKKIIIADPKGETEDDILIIELENGKEIKASPDTHIMADGVFKKLSDLKQGDNINIVNF